LVDNWAPYSPNEAEVSRRLGFEFGCDLIAISDDGLFTAFDREVLEEYHYGRFKAPNHSDAMVLEKPGIVSVPAEVGHTLEDRAFWDTLVELRLRWTVMA
jgi:uroporphyrinogen decarboxylase